MKKYTPKGGKMTDNTKCPICGYELKDCQCFFGGSCHPNRDKRREVVQDHLYLFNAEQLVHLIKLQAFWQISYGEYDKTELLKEYEYGKQI